MGESWRILEEFPDYRIYDDGNIVSHRRLKPRLLKGKYDKDGYKEFQLRDARGYRKYRRGHRLVGLAFLGEPPEEQPLINHKNGIKDDNRLENLEWSSVSENTQHGFDVLGRVKTKHGGNKVDLMNKDGEVVRTFDFISDAARYLNVSQANASSNYNKNYKGITPSRGFPKYLVQKKYYLVPHNNESVETIEKDSGESLSRVSRGSVPVEEQGDDDIVHTA